MDLEGKNYCGLTMNRNYNKEYVDIYMPTYIPKSLKIFSDPPPPPKTMLLTPQMNSDSI